MKFKLITLYIALFWFAIFVAGLWMLKTMIQAFGPDFAAGLFGGALWCLAMRGVWDALSSSLNDFRDEWRNNLSRSELKAIRAGLADVQAGRTKPLEQIRAELRERERIKKQEVCSDKSHWEQPG